jgi:hypothetical protein
LIGFTSVENTQLSSLGVLTYFTQTELCVPEPVPIIEVTEPEPVVIIPQNITVYKQVYLEYDYTPVWVVIGIASFLLVLMSVAYVCLLKMICRKKKQNPYTVEE